MELFNFPVMYMCKAVELNSFCYEILKKVGIMKKWNHEKVKKVSALGEKPSNKKQCISLSDVPNLLANLAVLFRRQGNKCFVIFLNMIMNNDHFNYCTFSYHTLVKHFPY